MNKKEIIEVFQMPREQYRELRAAGLDEYVMKFEMSHKDTFERLNPSTTFERRNQGIRWIREAGLLLGSGNIVDFPGQSLDELADDILLMKELEISWAPNIPFMPAALAGAFRVVDNRMLQDLAHVRQTAEAAGVPFVL